MKEPKQNPKFLHGVLPTALSPITSSVPPPRIPSNLAYNPLTGEFTVVSPSGDIRKVLPDEDNKIQTTIQGNRLSIKADRLAWFISTGIQPARFEVVFHKNLDPCDNRLHNLVLLQKKEHMQLQEAMKNISGALRLVPHPNDMFSYLLYYKHNGRMHREVVQDIAIARRKFNKLQLKCVKLISKYTVSD